MLYHILRVLFIPTFKAYFKSIHIHNKKGIPKKGPVILAVNHTSAFMDPILIAVQMDRVFHFLARGEAFNSPIARAIYSAVNMLPLYRPETMPDDVHKNKYVFQKCYEHLKNGKAIMMFPEGFSKTERRLRPIKSGLARMALGAESDNNFKLGIKVVAVGLNYSDPHQFGGEVFINIGEPINTSDYKELFEKNAKQAYDALTEDIKKAMEDSTVVISDERLDEFVKNLESLSHDQIKGNTSEPKLMQQFHVSKEIAEKVKRLAENESEKYEVLELRLKNYIQRLNRLNLKDHKLLSKGKQPFLYINMFLLLLSFPIFVLGYLSNIIPLKLTGLLTKKVEVREDFIGSLKSAGGMFIFLIYYILTYSVFGLMTSFTMALLLPVSFYFTGLFSIYYASRYYNIMDDYKHSRLSKIKPGSTEELLRARQEILNEIIPNSI